jgi:hypothetical protein
MPKAISGQEVLKALYKKDSLYDMDEVLALL